MGYPTTYANWIIYIRDYLDVDDYTTAQIDSFLSEAHLMLNRDLNSEHMEVMVPYTVPPSPTLPIPVSTIASDFNRVRLVNRLLEPALDVVTINEMIDKMAAKNKGDMRAVEPKWYCIDTKKLYVIPYLVEADVVQFWYYKKVPFLQAAGPTVNSNEFTDYHPDLLLVAACVAASPYLVEDERIPMWVSDYTKKVDDINKSAKDSKMGSTPLKREVKIYGKK